MKKRIFNPYKWKRKIKRGSKNSSDIIDIESRLNIRPTLTTNRWKREIRHIHVSEMKKRTFHIFFLVFALFAMTGICLFHPFFSLRTIEIQGLDRINEKQVYLSIKQNLEGKKWFVFSSSNYYLFQKSTLIQILKNQYPFETIQISKKFPHSLHILVTEKPAAFLLDTGKEYVLIAQTGERLETIRSVTEGEWQTVNSVIDTVITTSTSSTPEIVQQTIQTRTHSPDLSLTKIASKSYPMVSDPKGIMDQKTFSTEVVAGIQKWNQFLWEKQRIAVSFIELLENNEGYIKTSAGWGTYVSFFNTDQAFALFDDVFSKVDTATLHYIDFRYLQRIYWK
jgi:hypothetical protein